jgi:hypothetical protein
VALSSAVNLLWYASKSSSRHDLKNNNNQEGTVEVFGVSNLVSMC